MSIRASLDQVARAIRVVAELEPEVVQAANWLRTALLGGHKALACGNGGSVAASSHFAAEIACRFVQDRRPFPALGLATDGHGKRLFGRRPPHESKRRTE